MKKRNRRKKPAKKTPNIKQHRDKPPETQAIRQIPYKNTTRSIYVKYQKAKSKKSKSQEPPSLSLMRPLTQLQPHETPPTRQNTIMSRMTTLTRLAHDMAVSSERRGGLCRDRNLRGRGIVNADLGAETTQRVNARGGVFPCHATHHQWRAACEHIRHAVCRGTAAL